MYHSSPKKSITFRSVACTSHEGAEKRLKGKCHFLRSLYLRIFAPSAPSLLATISGKRKRKSHLLRTVVRPARQGSQLFAKGRLLANSFALLFGGKQAPLAQLKGTCFPPLSSNLLLSALKSRLNGRGATGKSGICHSAPLYTGALRLTSSAPLRAKSVYATPRGYNNGTTEENTHRNYYKLLVYTCVQRGE